jgi:putative ABC transport system ATP-binding protein
MVAEGPVRLRTEFLSAYFNGNTAVRHVTLGFPTNSVTAIIGPSGCGKSTYLRCLNRMHELSEGASISGRVLLDEHDIYAPAVNPIELRRRVGMVFQRPTPFPGTVLDNLRIAEPELSDDAAVHALARVELDGSFAGRAATELSGGEAQRMGLARTLVTSPEDVLMDEPASSVDPVGRKALEELARGLAAQGTPVIWVTHDLAQMRRIANHVLVVIDGRIAHAAPLTELEAGAPPPARRFLAEEAA